MTFAVKIKPSYDGFFYVDVRQAGMVKFKPDSRHATNEAAEARVEALTKAHGSKLCPHGLGYLCGNCFPKDAGCYGMAA